MGLNILCLGCYCSQRHFLIVNFQWFGNYVFITWISITNSKWCELCWIGILFPYIYEEEIKYELERRESAFHKSWLQNGSEQSMVMNKFIHHNKNRMRKWEIKQFLSSTKQIILIMRLCNFYFSQSRPVIILLAPIIIIEMKISDAEKWIFKMRQLK